MEKKKIKKEKRGKSNKKISKVNKNEVEEPRFQMNKLKLEKDLSDSRRMRGKEIDRERSLVLIIRSCDWTRRCLVKRIIFSFENNQKWKVFNWNMKT